MSERLYNMFRNNYRLIPTRFKVLLFVTYSIIQDIISSEIRTGPLNGQCKKIKHNTRLCFVTERQTSVSLYFQSKLQGNGTPSHQQLDDYILLALFSLILKNGY